MSDVVPEGWKISLLNELVSRIRTPVQYNPKNVLTISSTSGWMDQRQKWARNMAGESLKKYTQLNRGELSYNKGNSKTFPYGCVFKLNGWKSAAVPNVYHSFRINEGKADPDFIQYSFHGGCLDYQLRKIITSSVRANGLLNITASDFFNIELISPRLPEQQKIAAILTSVDEVIEQTQAQIDKLKDLKTAMMQELLTRGVGVDGKPHTEFKDSPVGRIPKGWEVALISELFQVQLGKMLSKASKIGNKPYPYLGNKNVQWGDVDLTNLETMDFKDAECKKFSLLKGDLLMCEGGDVGRTAIWQGEMGNCYYQKAIHRLRPIESSYEPFLLMEYMRYAKKTGLLVDYISQTSIAHLTKEKLISIPLPVPSVQEQQKIVCILKSITGKINLSATTLQKNKVLKKALMQDLLTGKVRVTVPAPSSPKASSLKAIA
ncbi:MAG: type I restriction enzyme S subunit [Psychromonas sp.]|jgi:type I restriction enzyme S subunit|uniref:restriction endonuclease subunit S n=1 Tax=Psychromonas sp. TaxID=1884585 RepID=UPI0039E541D5